MIPVTARIAYRIEEIGPLHAEWFGPTTWIDGSPRVKLWRVRRTVRGAEEDYGRAYFREKEALEAVRSAARADRAAATRLGKCVPKLSNLRYAWYMPQYEYHCNLHAEHAWEEKQSVHDAALETCPTCGGPARRLISRTSFALKGSGWASDNYGAPKPAPPTTPSAPVGNVTAAEMSRATSCPTVSPTPSKE